MKTSETLNLAADLIEQHGWTRGNGWPGTPQFTGKLCLEGGIMAATGQTVYDRSFATYPAYAAVRAYLDDKTPYIWNDNQGFVNGSPGCGWVGGTHESSLVAGKARVLEVLRACAVIEAAREDQDAAFATYAENVAVSA